ncbi:photosystem II reaction center protein PsbN [Stenotrophomonas sp. 278]|nr:photosystem II reaction center protein PsbN [Stenotrophomonas sp. 278]
MTPDCASTTTSTALSLIACLIILTQFHRYLSFGPVSHSSAQEQAASTLRRTFRI